MRLHSINTGRAALIVIGVLAAAPTSALAAVDGTATPAVSAALTPGALIVNAPSATLAFGTTALTGAQQTLPIDLAGWSVNDASGDALGWSLKTKVSTLADTVTPAQTLANAVVQFKALPDATSGDLAVTEGPTEAAGSGGYIDVAADSAAPSTSLATAGAGKGMGTWTFAATTGGLRLRVPSNAKVGSYAGTLTLTLSQTP